MRKLRGRLLLVALLVISYSIFLLPSHSSAKADSISYGWTDLGGELSPYKVRSLAWGNGILYAGSYGNGIWSYDPATEAWSNISAGHNFSTPICLIWDGSRLYAGLHSQGVWRYNPATGRWEDVGAAMGKDVQALAWDGSSLYAGTCGDGVWRYNPSLDQWTDISEGLGFLNIWSLGWFGGCLYAGTYEHGAWCYKPATGEWADTGGAVSEDVAFQCLGWDGTDLYAGTNLDGVWRYKVATGEWVEISPPGIDLSIFSFIWDGSYLYASSWGNGIWRYDPESSSWSNIGGGANYDIVYAVAWNGSTLYAGVESLGGGSGGGVWRYGPPTWYLTEGCTEGGVDTYVLIQNPEAEDTKVNVEFQTSAGKIAPPELQGITIPAQSRRTLKANHYVTDFNVSTKVEVVEGGSVICERSVYGNNNSWATGSIGSPASDRNWYFAEGCTDYGMETYILVQNPGVTDTVVNLTLDTEAGSLKPQRIRGVNIPAQSRCTFRLNDYISASNVSTHVWTTSGGSIICERAMYGDNRSWSTDSIGVISSEYSWYFSEGCTEGGMETYLLVNNPYELDAQVNISFDTGGGKIAPSELQGVLMPAYTRSTFKVNDYVTDYDVSTTVASIQGAVVCERAMYGGDEWATDSIGASSPANTWYFAEGCTCGGIETWLLVQNPNDSEVKVDLTFMTGYGPVPGPQGFIIAPHSRHSFNLGDYIADYDLSTIVTSRGGDIVCERAMYGGGRTWATASIGFAP